MRIRREIIQSSVILAVVAIIGIGLGWLGGRNTVDHQRVSEVQETPPTSQQSGGESGIIQIASISPESAKRGNPPVAIRSPEKRNEPVLDPEQEISDIVGADVEYSEKTRKLIKLFPQLPETDQTEAARHLANLLSDEEFPEVESILTNSQTSDEAAEILLDDLLNRANSVKVTMILAVARSATTTQAANAKDLLERILGDDYGNDWQQWELKAKEWLMENPD
jgi:hypothetical protein